MSAHDLAPTAPATNELSPATENLQPNATECDVATPNHLPTLTPPDPSPQHSALRTQHYSLTSRQTTALNLLLMGKPVSVIAHTLGLHRSTLSRWKSSNPFFIAELNRRQQEITETAAAKLRRLQIVAVNEIESAMKRDYFGDGAKVAFRLLATARTLPLASANPGPTDPELILDQILQREQAIADPRRNLLRSILSSYADTDDESPSPAPAPSTLSSPHLNPEP
jgi:hypothetical protein